MEINLTQKQEKIIKKISGKTNTTEVVQKMVDDWFDNLIRINYESKKTTEEMIDDLDSQ